MEKGELRCAIVAKDVEPSALIKHLAMLSALKNIPVCALQQASIPLGNIFQFKSSIACGFRKLGDEEKIPLNPLIEKIIEKIPKISVPPNYVAIEFKPPEKPEFQKPEKKNFDRKKNRNRNQNKNEKGQKRQREEDGKDGKGGKKQEISNA